MLPITLPQYQVDLLMKDADAGHELEVSLIDQTITRPDGSIIKFDIAAFRKECLVNGYDDIALSLLHLDKIEQFEKHRSATCPWLDGAQYGKRVVVSGKQSTDW